MPKKTTTETETTRTKNERYGQAYLTFKDLMASDEPVIEGLHLYVIPRTSGGEVYARATSYAQAMNAACLLVFGEPRKMTDRQKFDEARRTIRNGEPETTPDAQRTTGRDA